VLLCNFLYVRLPL